MASDKKNEVSELRDMLRMIRNAKKYVMQELKSLEDAEESIVKQIAACGEEGSKPASNQIQAQLAASTELLKNINHRKKCERHRIMMQATPAPASKQGL